MATVNPQGVSQLINVTDHFRDMIKNLRSFAVEYEELSEDQKKAVRHTLYQQEGEFGKIFFQAFKPALPKIAEHEVKLAAKNAIESN